MSACIVERWQSWVHVCSDLTAEHRQYRQSTAGVAAARLKRLVRAMAGEYWGFGSDLKSVCRWCMLAG